MTDDPYRPPASDSATPPSESAFVARGRRLFQLMFGVSVVQVLATTISGLVQGGPLVVTLMLALAQVFLLSPFYFLYRGGTRSRFVLIGLFVLQDFGVVKSLPDMTLSVGCGIFVASGLFAAWSALALALSRSLEAFLSFQRARG
jgi:hypothetical protein